MQDKGLLTRANANRKALTPFEARLWSALSRSQLGGFRFRRQHVIGNCIVDFFCPQKGLIVEVDGDTHNAARDAARDQVHARLGFKTLRFTNADVGTNIDGVLQLLLREAEALPNRWSDDGLPHPYPSPEGEVM